MGERCGFCCFESLLGVMSICILPILWWCIRNCYILDLELVVDLSLVCTFQKMRSHLNMKESDPTKFPAEKLAAVAEVLRKKSTFLRLSEDGVCSQHCFLFSCRKAFSMAAILFVFCVW